MVAALVCLQLLSFVLFTSCFPSYALASPFHHGITSHRHLFPRDFVVNNATGKPQIFNPDSNQPIPQSPGTDGSGANFSPAALLWISFCLGVGVPMSVAGIRGWKITTGVGIGLSGAVCSWAAFINTVSDVGIPDAVLAAFVFGFFFLGFILGLFDFARVGGITTLGITGGLAFGMRIVILKEGLLISNPSIFFLNWLLVGAFGVIGMSMMVSMSTQRAGIVLASASVGTFLVCFGIDLIVNRQSGMSRGLRFLCDRNVSHVLDLFVGGYRPTLSTQIILSVSLALTPFLAYIQHRVFKHPFSRKPRPDSAISYSLTLDPCDNDDVKTAQNPFSSKVPDGSRNIGPSRFSL